MLCTMFSKKNLNYIFSILKRMKIFLCMKCVMLTTSINIVSNDAWNVLKDCFIMLI
jgi:hypothetical protein